MNFFKNFSLLVKVIILVLLVAGVGCAFYLATPLSDSLKANSLLGSNSSEVSVKVMSIGDQPGFFQKILKWFGFGAEKPVLDSNTENPVSGGEGEKDTIGCQKEVGKTCGKFYPCCSPLVCTELPPVGTGKLVYYECRTSSQSTTGQ